VGLKCEDEETLEISLAEFQTYPRGVEVPSPGRALLSLIAFQTYPRGVEVLNGDRSWSFSRSFRRTLVGLK